MRNSHLIPMLACLALPLPGVQSQLLFNGAAAKVDFDTTVPGVNEGAFLGTGLTPSPSAGLLDSDAWAITGFSDGDLAFGATATTGDFARGSDGDGVTTGGLYAFEVGGSADVGLGFQATGTDFTPGAITLRISNASGATVNEVTVGYQVYGLNNGDRSTSLDFSFSLDGSVFSPAPALDYTSALAADTNPTWIPANRSLDLSSLGWAAGADLFLRWTSEDIGGTGSRDELAIDNLVLSVPEPSETALSVLLGLVGFATWRTRRPRVRDTDCAQPTAGSPGVLPPPR
ncbi:MAG: hypothetical protein H7A45_03130 [Verrucomicrobiales bacterium]|nr:hypothetical protein [Verrucomicrobiales bacterium]